MLDIEQTVSVSEDEAWVFFAVFDCHDRDFLQQSMRIQPNLSWLAGDPISENFPDAQRLRSQWMLTSGLSLENSFEEHFSSLLEKLEPRAKMLRSVMARYPAGIGVSQFFYESQPDYFLGNELTVRFKKLGLKVSFDQLGISENGIDSK